MGDDDEPKMRDTQFPIFGQKKFLCKFHQKLDLVHINMVQDCFCQNQVEATV